MRIHPPGSIQYIDCDDFSVAIMSFHGYYHFSHLRKISSPEGPISTVVGATLTLKGKEREGSLRLQRGRVFSILTFSFDAEPNEDHYTWVIENETWQLLKPWVHSFFPY